MSMKLLNQLPDIPGYFKAMESQYFFPLRMEDFSPDSGIGRLFCKRFRRKWRMGFNQVVLPFEECEPWEFPVAYPADPECPFSVSFLTSRTLRLRFTAGQRGMKEAQDSPMITGDLPADGSWQCVCGDGYAAYNGGHASLGIQYNPFSLEIRDSSDRVITKTVGYDKRSNAFGEAVPFSFIRTQDDLSRKTAVSFAMSAGEKIFGCGESFTALNKRGQAVCASTVGNHGGQSGKMYKPVPFFMSSRGYGIFVHTSVPVTFDFGHDTDDIITIYVDDDFVDIFVFLGTPKEILSEYTAVTGRSPVPPLWSFGLWMGRMSYRTEEEVRRIAVKMRESAVPCDVMHIDVGWFKNDWICDYKFCDTKFPSPGKMISDLRSMGFRVSLWQIPYITPNNALYREAVEKGFLITDCDGNPATEDAIVDFSNPEAVAWYQALLARLLEAGISCIKADFGEAAPYHGHYASGKSGRFEHNLYPLRYNKAVADITRKIRGDSIIWARSAWAGSQRYPVHWGGDVHTTDCGMAASLRAGLSMGLSGFSFWSHDIGGFTGDHPEDLYSRWLPFGMLTSHSRCHGSHPKEPWEYSERFVELFRKTVEMKYRLMPYVYAQAVHCSRNGLPMMRALFCEYPEDGMSWRIDDEYLFGNDLLAAPLFSSGSSSRNVYLPPGSWIDYQSGRTYRGGTSYTVEAGEIPAVIMVKDGAVLPCIGPAQCTEEMDWKKIELILYTADKKDGTGLFCLPGENTLNSLRLSEDSGKAVLTENPLPNTVTFSVSVIRGT